MIQTELDAKNDEPAFTRLQEFPPVPSCSKLFRKTRGDGWKPCKSLDLYVEETGYQQERQERRKNLEKTCENVMAKTAG